MENVRLWGGLCSYFRSTAEDGDFLALDLGGTNFRVLHVKMVAGECKSCVSKNYNVPTSILTGPCVLVRIAVHNHPGRDRRMI